MRCFQVHPNDNVATLLGDAPASVVLNVLNSPSMNSIETVESIQLGHKIALTAITAGQPIIKYSVPIGSATCSIAKGAWVHLHNCASNYDARSQTLDLHTGATADTKYE